MKILRSFLLVLAFTAIAIGAEIEAVFPPRGDATGVTVREIDQARDLIEIQAYGFTSEPIGYALLDARRRGVRIVIVCDKSNLTSKYSLAPELLRAGAFVYVDAKPPIAHAKVMIIDKSVVLAGSFNWTRQAQKNSEVLNVITHAPDVVVAYRTNFLNRVMESTPWREMR